MNSPGSEPAEPRVAEAWLRVDPGELAGAARVASDAALAVRSAGGALVGAAPRDWRGRAQQAEQVAAADLQAQLDSLATVLTLLGGELAVLAGQLAAAQQAWWEAVRAQQAWVATPALGAGLGTALAAAARTRAVEAAEALQAADHRAAAVIAGLPRWSAPAPFRAGDPATPAVVQHWWAGLLPAVRQALLDPVLTAPGPIAAAPAGLPSLLAGLDGVPEQVRDTLNRRALAAAGQAGPGLAALRAALAEPAASQLLMFDPAGDGRAVLGVGPVATAAHLVVFVPGMSTTLADIDRLVRQAEAVLAASRPQDSLAAVVWLGYDAPDVLQVVLTAAARAGAASLQRFVAGLRLLHPDVTVTLVGHSYGSLVVGTAARRGLAADELVFVGSPGVGVDRAGQLAPPGQVWAARAPGDPIAAVFRAWEPVAAYALQSTVLTSLNPVWRYGPDPTSTRFGATVFRTGPGVRGHSEYFTAGSESARNIERIAVEDPADVTRVEPRRS